MVSKTFQLALSVCSDLIFVSGMYVLTVRVKTNYKRRQLKINKKEPSKKERLTKTK